MTFKNFRSSKQAGLDSPLTDIVNYNRGLLLCLRGGCCFLQEFRRGHDDGATRHAHLGTLAIEVDGSIRAWEMVKKGHNGKANLSVKPFISINIRVVPVNQ